MKRFKQTEKSWLYLNLRDEADGPAHTYPRKQKENEEQDHISACEISETHLTTMKTDVPSDFY